MTLEARIEQIERTNRRWRRTACAMAVGILAVANVGAIRDTEDELVLRKLVIQDEQGRERIVMRAKEGEASIRHFDTDATMRLEIATTPDGTATIAHYDANGKKRVVNGTLANGQAFVQHFDTNDRMRIVSGTMPGGKAAVQHHDADERKRVVTATLPDGKAVTAWWTCDAEGNSRMAKILP